MKKQFFSFLTVIGLISILAVSCNQETLDITPKTYSGEEYFKSIFLLQGELTEQIPSLRHFAKYIILESEESMTAIINQIDEKDPSFLSDLETAIASNNANQVEMAMDRGNALLEVLALQNATLDSGVEEQLAKINSSDYDFTNEVDVKKFVNTVNRVVDSNSKSSGNLIEEIGTEKCVMKPLILIIWIIVPSNFKHVEDNSGNDKFFREKLVSEIVSLN